LAGYNTVQLAVFLPSQFVILNVYKSYGGVFYGMEAR